MPLQVRRGTTAEVNSIRPLIGELVYDTQLKRVLIGDSLDGGVTGTLGGTPIAGITANEAKDAAAASLLAGTHQNISFTYNSTTKSLSAKVDILVHDTIEADAVSTAAIKDGSTVVLDVANAFLTGDVKGSVFADDSTLLVDAVDGRFFGDLTGNVTGNVIGSVTGNVITNSISSADSSSIVCDTPLDFQTNVLIEGTLTVRDGINAVSNNPTGFPLYITASYNSDESSQLVIRRSRGTPTSQTALNVNDRIGSLQFNGFDGSIFSPAASIQARVTGAVSPGIVPTSLRFLITNAAGVEREAGRFNDSGFLFLFANDVNDSPLQIFSGHNDGSNASNIILVRSRGAASVPGTTGTPLAVQNGDAIFDFAFAGYDGTANRAVAQMRVVTDGAVSAGVVPGRFDFFTTNLSGASAVRLSIATTKTTFNNVPVLPTYADETAADTAIGGSGNRVNGMMYYDTALGKIRAVAGGSWVDLH